ncbi:hypothetical protein PEXP_006550 [Penicillium expansum]|nr:hypothetical protein PEXP_006550 [Penicillium expansum]
MSFLQIRPAFKFSTNIFGQLEAEGTTYFDGFIAVPGNRAHIESMPGFVPTVVATAIDVDSRYVEIVLGERSHLDATIQLTYVTENFIWGHPKPKSFTDCFDIYDLGQWSETQHE